MADIVFRKALQFALIVALMRMLTPEAFGTMALVYVFLEFAAILVESGFAAALTQRQDVTHIDESTIFWFNVLMGLILAVGFWVGSPLVARLYGLPELEVLVSAMSVAVFLNSLGGVQQTLLSKNLNFRPITIVGITSSIASASVAFFLAWNGFGIWALAAQVLIGSLTINCGIWLASSWRPLWRFEQASLNKLFSFGGYMFLASLADLAYKGISSFVVVRLFGVKDLGFFSRAENLRQIPIDMITITLTRVAFPAFSARSSDTDRLRSGTQLALSTIMLLNAPLMIGLAVIGDKFIPIAFGERWIPAIPLLKILALAGVIWPAHTLNLNVIKACGQSRLYFRADVALKLIGLGLVAIGSLYGIEGLAWGQVVFAALAFAVTATLTGSAVGYGVTKQARDIAPILVVALIMGILVELCGDLTSNTALALAIQLLMGTVSYWLMCHLFRVRAFFAAQELIRARSKRG